MIFLGTSTQCEPESNYNFQVHTSPQSGESVFRRRVGEATSARGPLSRRVGGQPRLDRGGRPLPSRWVSGLPTVQGAPAQPHGQDLFFRDAVEPLPGRGGHPPSSFETWGHPCQVKKDPRPRVPEPLCRGAGVTARRRSTEQGDGNEGPISPEQSLREPRTGDPGVTLLSLCQSLCPGCRATEKGRLCPFPPRGVRAPRSRSVAN